MTADTAAAPVRRRGRRTSRSGALSLALALALIGLVAVAQWRGEVGRSSFTSSAVQVLAAQALELQEEQTVLLGEIAAYEGQIAEFQQRGGESQSTLDLVNQRLQNARLAAGLTAVRGPGVLVVLADSNRVVPEGANPADFVVQVDDLRDTVASLWASGAEAISVNDQRLVSTTSIYGVGSAVLVNTAFLSPPFEIRAIGPADLEQRFLDHPTFVIRAQQRIDSFDLEFATQSADDIEVPAFVGNTTFRWAVAEGADR